MKVEEKRRGKNARKTCKGIQLIHSFFRSLIHVGGKRKKGYKEKKRDGEERDRRKKERIIRWIASL